MKTRLYILLFILTAFSCEEVIEIDLPAAEPRLVIDASIEWIKGTDGSEQEIKLSLSAPYFENEIPPANGAQVTIEDSNSNSFIFIEDGASGIYKNNSFIPVMDEVYTLTIIYESQIYTATESLISVSPIEDVEQNENGGFSGEETEIKAFYTDPVDEENYYFFEFRSDIPVIPSLEVYRDEFVNGNRIFGFYTEEDLEAGDIVNIRIHGISERFYDFMFILLQQNSEEGGGPFETQPATVRGNCNNETNPDNFPFGYFRLSEVDEFVYQVQ